MSWGPLGRRSNAPPHSYDRPPSGTGTRAGHHEWWPPPPPQMRPAIDHYGAAAVRSTHIKDHLTSLGVSATAATLGFAVAALRTLAWTGVTSNAP